MSTNNNQNTNLLPTSRKEMLARGWEELDVILFSGDAYIDHPSFGIAVLGRVLESKGYRVGIVPQPNWRDDLRDFKKMGKPRLFFGVSAGAMDSMVNHYTANKRLRSDDAYTPGGKAGYRPDYPTIVYSQILKSLFPDVPLIIGGVEASMRRFTHYDYWQDKLKPSILIESGADLLVYGMGEKAIIDIARLIEKGVPVEKLFNIPQTAYKINREMSLNAERDSAGFSNNVDEFKNKGQGYEIRSTGKGEDIEYTDQGDDITNTGQGDDINKKSQGDEIRSTGKGEDIEYTDQGNDIKNTGQSDNIKNTGQGADNKRDIDEFKGTGGTVNKNKLRGTGVEPDIGRVNYQEVPDSGTETEFEGRVQERFEWNENDPGSGRLQRIEDNDKDSGTGRGQEQYEEIEPGQGRNQQQHDFNDSGQDRDLQQHNDNDKYPGSGRLKERFDIIDKDSGQGRVQQQFDDNDPGQTRDQQQHKYPGQGRVQQAFNYGDKDPMFFKTGTGGSSKKNAVLLFSHEECLSDKKKYAANFRLIEEESNKLEPATIIQSTGKDTIVVNPPYPVAEESELDKIYDLPFTRLPHPRYNKKGSIPAYEMIRHSVTMHRGCFGGCSFCTISAHQGKFVSSRSEKSVIREVENVKKMPDFKGYISDLGGPSANMYKMQGKDIKVCAKCKKPSCIFPVVCPNLETSPAPLLSIYRKVRAMPGIKKAFVGSGVRYDLFLDKIDQASYRDYARELIKHHVSGRLKVAPEHSDEKVLKLMRKPSFSLYKRMQKLFDKINREEKLNQQLIPYFISSHPGCGNTEMAELAVTTKEMNIRPEQVQDFTPTPMTLATVIYYTSINPYTMEKVKVARGKVEKLSQQQFFFWYKQEYRGRIKAELFKMGRKDLAEKLLGKGK
jgi:radical SAM superfamily enzyme YgiQ (UPF0313 family)